MEYKEKWGTSVEEAVKLALVDLRCSEEDVVVTVLEEPTRGFLGLGRKLAKVRVEVKAPVEEKPAKPAKKEKAAVDQQKIAQKEFSKKTKKRPEDRKKKDKNSAKKSEKKPEETKKRNLALDDIDVSSLTDVQDHEALSFLKDIADKMGLELDFRGKTGKDLVYIEMSGKDSRTIIGKRGQTLDAIQYLTSLVINKDNDKYTKVVIDAENYREKRQKTLEQLANRLAAKVVKTKKHVRLEPMNPYERKVIHATLQKNPNITTRSEGEEPYRRVVIELKK